MDIFLELETQLWIDQHEGYRLEVPSCGLRTNYQSIFCLNRSE